MVIGINLNGLFQKFLCSSSLVPYEAVDPLGGSNRQNKTSFVKVFYVTEVAEVPSGLFLWPAMGFLRACQILLGPFRKSHRDFRSFNIL